MWMDYSMICMYDNESLPQSDSRRYILVLRGAADVHIDNLVFNLSQHDALIIPAKTEVLFRIKSTVAKHSLLLGCIEMNDAEITTHNISLITAENTDFVRRVFYLALDMQDTTDPFYDSVNAAIHQLMLVSLIAADLKAHCMNPQVSAVITDINKHFTDVEYDVRKAIEQTGYTMNHFRKLFREEVGITPTNYVTLRRLDRAVELFQQFKDHIPIKEIAWQSGYQDPYYFSRQFKKRFKMSPQQYIEQL